MQIVVSIDVHRESASDPPKPRIFASSEHPRMTFRLAIAPEEASRLARQVELEKRRLMRSIRNDL